MHLNGLNERWPENALLRLKNEPNVSPLLFSRAYDLREHALFRPLLHDFKQL